MYDQPVSIKSARKENKAQLYFLMVIMIAFSGFPFFTTDPYFLLGAFLFVFVFWFRTILNRLEFKKILLYFSLLIIVFLGQSITFNTLEYREFLTLIVRMSFALILVIIIGKSLPELYVNVMYVISLISLFFYLLIIIFPDLEMYLLKEVAVYFKQTMPNDSFYTYNSNIILYKLENFDYTVGFYRNPGPFWEPGGFACYLVPAIIFNTIKNKIILTKKNIVLLLTLITTFATGGFISLFFFILFVLLVNVRKNRMVLIPAVIMIGILGGYYVYNLSFVKLRVDRTIYYLAHPKESSYLARDRAVSAIVDIQDLVKHPLFGMGRGEERYNTMLGGEFSSEEHRNNGVTDFLLKFGIIFGVYYFRKILLSLKYICQINNNKIVIAWAALITIVIFGSTQIIFMQTFFIGLSFLPIVLSTAVIKEIH